MELNKSKNNKDSFEKEPKINKGESLIKCIYEVKDKNEVQIINNKFDELKNEDIETKIKIWNTGKNNIKRPYNL